MRRDPRNKTTEPMPPLTREQIEAIVPILLRGLERADAEDRAAKRKARRRGGK